MCFAAGELTCSKVTRPLIESHITALVIPPDLQTSKTVKTAVLVFTLNSFFFNLLIYCITIISVNHTFFFNFKDQEPINTCSGVIHF